MAQKIFDILPPEKVRFEAPLERHSPNKKILFLFISILLIVSAFCYFKLPKAEIEVWPERETLSFEDNITANIENYQINLLDKIIPAKIFPFSESDTKEFTTSGISEKEERATGTIRVYNDYDQSLTLIARTRFQPPVNGKILYFRSTKKISIPSKGYVDVEVVADEPGPDYNIEPTTFSVPGLAGHPQYTFIYGKSFEPMNGGVKEGVPIVLEEDLEQAKSILTKELFNRANQSLQAKISEGYILFEEAKKDKILEATSSIEVGEEAQYFNLSAAVEVKALLFKRSDLEEFAKSFILAEIAEGKKINEETLEVDFSLVSVDTELEEISLDLKFQALVFSEIDETFLKQALKGKSEEEANILAESLPKIINIDINLFPFWVKKIPANIDIKLNINGPA